MQADTDTITAVSRTDIWATAHETKENSSENLLPF